MDNQQQQQTTILAERSVGELLMLAAGLVTIGIIGIWGLDKALPGIIPVRPS